MFAIDELEKGRPFFFVALIVIVILLALAMARTSNRSHK